MKYCGGTKSRQKKHMAMRKAALGACPRAVEAHRIITRRQSGCATRRKARRRRCSQVYQIMTWGDAEGHEKQDEGNLKYGVGRN
jgi:hypothetical protein